MPHRDAVTHNLRSELCSAIQIFAVGVIGIVLNYLSLLPGAPTNISLFVGLGVIVLGFTNTARGSVLVPGYGDGQYVGLALFFIGTLAGAVSLVNVLTPRRALSVPSDAGPVDPNEGGPDVTAAAVRR